MDKAGVLLLAHGTPDSVSEIPEYLRNVTGGRPIPDSVIEEVKHRYERIGQSPLTRITLRQGELLAQLLDTPVYVGMRNWKPYIADVVTEMRADGITSAIALCLAPQNSRTSVGLYRKALQGVAEDVAIDFIESWHDHPLLITAFAEKLEAARAMFGRDIPVIFTAHSVPARTISDGDPYEQQARETGALLARRVGMPQTQWAFAFQSQGMSGGPWIGPTVEETITQFKDAGSSRVLIQPVGFVCDHVEVLYDIDIGFREFGSRVGVDVVRAESLNDSPAFITALADLIMIRGRANKKVTRAAVETTKHVL